MDVGTHDSMIDPGSATADSTEKATMDALIIRGGRRLSGRVEVSGAKNAALPVMAATLLAPGVHTLRNVPLLSDTRTMASVLERLGARVEFRGHACKIDTSNVSSVEAPYDLVRTMRASVYVLGPLLARFGAARVSLPGGCAWGPRPVNLHLDGLNAMNAQLEIDHGYIVGKDVRLRGAQVNFDVVSVGATAQLMMAAVLAEGTTTLDNVAIEPDITVLGEILSGCGARIEGLGTRRITVHGVRELRPIDTTIIPDRIEAATLLAAVGITGGSVTLERCEAGHMAAAMHKLEEMGCEILPGNGEVTISGPSRPSAVDVTTAPFPGFPTDMQAQMMALCAVADGTSVITDTIYLDRFTHVPELQRLGAQIELKNNSAVIRGVERLQGAPVMATDIRASAALVLAALVAEGETRISRIYHLDRGYEQLETKLRGLGADVERIQE
ncbi:MAG TPA: UDP-N-acetylglucosamine 1-carboxyvinyltransferase [Candidatus Saccharimonadaceae bacterium]|jgi:UDP-N-acetylglucosamine 1-carboxyvinyltransferase|nr:UDP-N-acetylglucosamine 1-carboxyvinyltransferase [Candidatus Saccharimonadaceae bacterium]